MKRFFIFLFCLMFTFASAEGLDNYINTIEQYTDQRARTFPIENIDYKVEMLFNFQDSILLLQQNKDCYAWENLSQDLMYNICDRFLENFSKYDGLCIGVLQSGENEIHLILNKQEAESYSELLSLAKAS